MILVKKIREKKPQSFKSFMPIKVLLKIINQLYDEKINSSSNPIIKEQEVIFFFYKLLKNFVKYKIKLNFSNDQIILDADFCF